MCFFLSHSFVALAVCFVSLSCWNTNPWSIFNALAGFNALALTDLRCSAVVCPLSRITPKHNVSTSMFDGGDGVLGVGQHSSSSKHGELSWCQRAGFWSHLTTTLSSSSPLNHWHTSDRLYMCFLEPGNLRELQDFSPSQRSVLPIVFLGDYGPSLISLTRSSRVVLGWFLTVLMIIETPRGEILHGATVRGRLTVILCFFHLRIIAPNIITFLPSCLAMVL